ncbi:DUF411 domain-containing protein [Erythrobacter sp. THAF29]|uniref:DUF411 domain-containing protein n=1 Tax=Erythrobacter sp. THAF29 TaxID=2587851 RepID=UPI001268131C|nr:DUF411 domain-containing protein [Erythrobacter sp. THAF29]QFT78829.1 hypothetical protein FIU90_14865 [Erythrobacter sp. THAF29]
MKKRILASLLMLVAACSGAAHAADVIMFRDPNCGCCLKWVEHVREYWAANGQAGEVKTVDNPQMQALKYRAGVPADLASCHTTIIGNYVIEGHVPAADVARLLKERPQGVRGLAVAGMPIGSPGMEHGNHRQAFKVIAFGPGGRNVWSSYPATGG